MNFNLRNIGHLGLVNYSDRKIEVGSQYDQYFPLRTKDDTRFMGATDVFATRRAMKSIVEKSLDETLEIAQYLKGKTVRETCQNLWNFLFKHVRYTKDRNGIEHLRSPLSTWKDRKGDCDDYSIFISSVLSNLGIPHIMRMAKYNGKDFFQHIYVVVPNGSRTITVDPVVDAFDYEEPYTEKDDLKISPMNLSGLGYGNGYQYAGGYAGLGGWLKDTWKGIKRYNPVSAAIRAGLASAFRDNTLNFSEKLGYVYLTQEQAEGLNIDLNQLKKFRDKFDKVEKIWTNGLEGKESMLKSEILIGWQHGCSKHNLPYIDRGYVGNPDFKVGAKTSTSRYEVVDKTKVPEKPREPVRADITMNRNVVQLVNSDIDRTRWRDNITSTRTGSSLPATDNPEGKFIKSTASGTVYLIKGGKRWKLSTTDQSGKTIYSDTGIDLAKIPLGGDYNPTLLTTAVLPPSTPVTAVVPSRSAPTTPAVVTSRTNQPVTVTTVPSNTVQPAAATQTNSSQYENKFLRSSSGTVYFVKNRLRYKVNLNSELIGKTVVNDTQYYLNSIPSGGYYNSKMYSTVPASLPTPAVVVPKPVTPVITQSPVVSSRTAQQASVTTPATRSSGQYENKFLRTSSGTVYFVKNGLRYKINSNAELIGKIVVNDTQNYLNSITSGGYYNAGLYQSSSNSTVSVPKIITPTPITALPATSRTLPSRTGVRGLGIAETAAASGVIATIAALLAALNPLQLFKKDNSVTPPPPPPAPPVPGANEGGATVTADGNYLLPDGTIIDPEGNIVYEPEENNLPAAITAGSENSTNSMMLLAAGGVGLLLLLNKKKPALSGVPSARKKKPGRPRKKKPGRPRKKPDQQTIRI